MQAVNVTGGTAPMDLKDAVLGASALGWVRVETWPDPTPESYLLKTPLFSFWG